jgi:hypothetical protein
MRDNCGKAKLLDLFERHPGEEIALNVILRLGVAQYNARIKQLRDEGHRITNRTEWKEGRKFSWFKYEGKL